jgi:hypothetical protein
MSVWRVTAIVASSCLLAYGALTASLYWLMRQPLDRFGAVMRHVPGVAMAALPFKPIWMRVRAGVIQLGDVAPDFDLPTVDRSRHVRISEAYRTQPVVLIFGSYT